MSFGQWGSTQFHHSHLCPGAGMDIMSLESLAQEVGGKIPPIAGIGGIMVKPEGFIMMNVQIPCVKGYNEDQIAIVIDDPGLNDCPVILGTPTIFRVMEVIKESEISEWQCHGLLQGLLVDETCMLV